METVRGQSGAFTNTSAILRRPLPAVTKFIIILAFLFTFGSLQQKADGRGAYLFFE